MPPQSDAGSASFDRDAASLLRAVAPGLTGILYRCQNDQSWTMVDLAEPIRELTGYEPEELIGDALLPFNELIYPPDRDRVWREVQEAVDSGAGFQIAYRIRTRAGDVRWVWEQGRAVRAKDGREELIGYIQDVTDMLGARDRLLEKTFASLTEAVLIMDLAEGRRQIVDMNPATERMFGWSRDELLGETTEPLHVDRAQFQRFHEEHMDRLLRERVIHSEYPLRRQDGTTFAAEQTIALLDPEAGLEGGAVVVVRDVSERTELERRLRKSQKLEAVGRLAGGVAHDFNNLLTVIRAHSDFTLFELPDDSPLRSEIEAIQRAADGAAELTEQLLAFGREQVLRPRVVELNEVVRAVVQLLERTLGEDVRIELRLTSEALPVHVDPSQLEQVVVNLAVNARDAMPRGGVLTLVTERVEAEEGQGSDEPLEVCLRIRDTGIGMDEATRARVFEPFFTTKDRLGTGLGLATVYGVVTQSGGVIEVESEPGEGTTFTIRFLRATGEAETLRPAESDRVEDRVEEPTEAAVLIIEDDDSVRRVARRILERDDLTVHTAPDGETGLRILADGPGEIDLLLTDLVLPGISGREVAARAREHYPDLRILVMSGYDGRAPGSRSDDLPAEVAFIPKPFTPAGLREAVGQLLGQR